MIYRRTRVFGYATMVLMAISTQGLAEVEHVTLDQPCEGQTGRAIASYSWFEGDTLEREHLFTDLCLDLSRMAVFGVENSDELIPAYRAPGQMTYHSYPPGYTDRYEETVTLLTDILFLGDFEEVMANPEILPDPEDPDALSTFTWVKGGSVRPLDRIGRGTASFRGFVGGTPLKGDVVPGRYFGYAEHMVGTNEAEAGLSGVGFSLEAEVAATASGAEVEMQALEDVAVVEQATATLTLDFAGDEISGHGRFTAEHAALAPDTDQVWARFDLEVADLTGKLIGENGEQFYVLVVWEGTYTDLTGQSFPANSIMTFHAGRPD